jgi:hypothetical protein
VTCLLLSEQARLAELDLSPFLPGVGTVRGRELLHGVWLRQRKGVMADPGLSVWLGPRGLAGPRSFGLILAGVPWAARVAD